MRRRKAFIVVTAIGLSLILATTAILWMWGKERRELWRGVDVNGHELVMIGQRYTFGISEIDIITQRLDQNGRILTQGVTHRCTTWEEAQRTVNNFHREFYGDTHENFRENIAPLVSGIGRASNLTAYEGLPHQYFEKRLLEKELKAKASITFHGFPFYKAPIDLQPDDASWLTAHCSAATFYGTYGGAKMCGGFHPDWCLQWNGEAGTYRLLICFGCHEARLYGPKREVWSDLNEDLLADLVEVMKPYRTNRPQPIETE